MVRRFTASPGGMTCRPAMAVADCTYTPVTAGRATTRNLRHRHGKVSEK